MQAPLIDTFRFLLHTGVTPGQLAAYLWRTRWATLATVLAPVAVAAMAAFLLPRWYGSGATLTVDTGASAPVGSGVVGLAAQLGFTGTVGSASPQFYADLLTSRLLLERLLAGTFPLGPEGKPESLEQYWNQGRVSDARSHDRNLSKLRKHLSASANARTGVISFNVEGPERTVAKLMADTALAVLNDLVVSIRRRHASAERHFLEERWEALRDSLSAHESSLRSFYERNRQITSPPLQFEELRLRREVDRVQTIYAQIGAQLEQARIQEVRDVPAISVIDPPVAPVRKSQPRFSLLFLTGAFLGTALAITIGLVRTAGAQARVSQG
jgi:uncharacterized protein involved in exopolysaccharide biosynthesis